MTTLEKSADTRSRLLKLAGMALAGGLFGYGSAWLVIQYSGLPSPDSVRWSDLGAMLVALMLVAGGLSVLAASRSGRALAAATAADAPAGPAEMRDMRLQGAVLILSGLLLAAPLVAVLSGNAAPVLTLVAIGVVFVLHTAMNLSLWRRGDEMVRRVVLEAGGMAFWIGQAALFGWAVAERLGVAPPLTAWDILVVVMGLYLTCSVIVGLRRGLS
ncbi:MAG: hypothetical protein ACK4FB_06840 [Brevundimonas sp.]|uniref:hypothetical protein n=1 Tax=Brevundimonas sp. TaxID=1871086 RepID=UPI00391AA87E